MRKNFCDICRKEKLEVELVAILKDLFLSEKPHHSLNEVCMWCIDDVASLVTKHIEVKRK